MAEKDVKVNPMNTSARVMEITVVGLIILLAPAPGLAYLAGQGQFVDPNKAIEHWGDPASTFWEETNGMHVSGYSWFLDNLGYMDMLSVFGAMCIAVVPLISVIAAIPRSKKIFGILLIVVAIEFIVG